MNQQEQFLAEHNSLSPLNLRATLTLLTRFRAERPSLFEGDEWSMEKLRRPFIMWLTSLPVQKNSKPAKESFCIGDGVFAKLIN